MRTASLSLLSLILFSCTVLSRPACAAEKQPPRPEVRVVVDPRVELISIIFRLAGNPEYNQGRVESYTKDVESHFGPFRQHRVVELAREFRRTRGVSFDACMSMAVHLADAYGLSQRVPLEPRPAALDLRWRPEDARAFLDAARSFVEDTSFKAFVEKHRSLYETAESRMKALLEKEGHLEWFDRFFGSRPHARYVVAVGLLNGGCCYGPHFRDVDGKEELFCILGAWQTDKDGLPEFTRDMLKTVVHEFGHSYANPVVNAHAAELKEAGQKLFPTVAPAMRSQAYGNWQTMFYESLVRASVVRYVRQYEGAEAARIAAKKERARGFPWIEDLSGLLGEYEGQRDRYPTLESFSPRLIAFFNEYAEKEAARAAKRPKIVSVTPANGAEDVDPSAARITVVFDRPMRDGFWSLVGGGPHFPEVTGKPSYDSKRTTWSVPVKLKPEWEYQFMLNSPRFQSFRSEEGEPLAPVNVSFKTGKLAASGKP